MGILYMNTADVGDTTLFQSASLTVSPTQARTGSNSFYDSSTGASHRIAFPNTVAGYGRICVYPTNFGDGWAIYLREGISSHLMFIMWPLSGTYRLVLGGTWNLNILAEGTGVPGIEIWAAVEFYWNIHDSTGVFTAKINGNQVLTFSGDTRVGGIGAVNNISFGYGGTASVGMRAYYDDIIVRDDQWPMRGGIHVLLPNADGDTVNWTKSDALKEYHEHINTQPPSYTDYLETDATVAATKQLTHLTTLADDVWNIRGVGAHVNCKSTVSTDAFVRTLLLPADIGAAQAVGSDFGVETVVSWAKTYYEENPHDSAAWEKADIDDLQIGVETRVPA